MSSSKSDEKCEPVLLTSNGLLPSRSNSAVVMAGLPAASPCLCPLPSSTFLVHRFNSSSLKTFTLISTVGDSLEQCIDKNELLALACAHKEVRLSLSSTSSYTGCCCFCSSELNTTMQRVTPTSDILVTAADVDAKGESCAIELLARLAFPDNPDLECPYDDEHTDQYLSIVLMLLAYAVDSPSFSPELRLAAAHRQNYFYVNASKYDEKIEDVVNYLDTAFLVAHGFAEFELRSRALNLPTTNCYEMPEVMDLVNAHNNKNAQNNKQEAQD